MSNHLAKILRSGAVALAAALLLANAAPKEEQFICVTGPTWRPSVADGVGIEAEPVPASYRTLFESKKPCIRWALQEGSLIDWHIRFGSERSISAALAYLKRDYIRGLPATERYGPELERAWRSALPDLRRALKIEEPPKSDYSAKHRFMDKSLTVRRFRELERARDNYRFLAEQHLKSAEEFGSERLLAKAELYLRPVQAGAAILEPLSLQEPAAGLFSFDVDEFRTEDFRMRSAILRARLSRSAPDLAAAERIVKSFERPLYSRLAEAVFSGGEDFCDISDDWNEVEALRAVCGDDHSAINRLTNYWINRAALDLIAGNRETRSGEFAFRLLNRERTEGRKRGYHRRSEEDLLRLRLLSADDHRRRLETPGTDEHDLDEPWQGALRELQEAELLAPAHSSPARFRRIAEGWLEIWDRGETLFKPSEEGFSRAGMTEQWRYAAYLRRLLAGLEEVTSGGPAAPQ